MLCLFITTSCGFPSLPRPQFTKLCYLRVSLERNPKRLVQEISSATASEKRPTSRHKVFPCENENKRSLSKAKRCHVTKATTQQLKGGRKKASFSSLFSLELWSQSRSRRQRTGKQQFKAVHSRKYYTAMLLLNKLEHYTYSCSPNRYLFLQLRIYFMLVL